MSINTSNYLSPGYSQLSSYDNRRISNIESSVRRIEEMVQRINNVVMESKIDSNLNLLIEEGIEKRDFQKACKILETHKIDLNKKPVLFSEIDEGVLIESNLVLRRVIDTSMNEGWSAKETIAYIELLLTHGADLTAELSKYKDTIVYDVIWISDHEKRREIMDYLLSKKDLFEGVDLSKNFKELHYSIGRLEVLNFLIEMGADISVCKNLNGIALLGVLPLSSPDEYYEMLKAMINGGYDFLATDDDGCPIFSLLIKLAKMSSRNAEYQKCLDLLLPHLSDYLSEMPNSEDLISVFLTNFLVDLHFRASTLVSSNFRRFKEMEITPLDANIYEVISSLLKSNVSLPKKISEIGSNERDAIRDHFCHIGQEVIPLLEENELLKVLREYKLDKTADLLETFSSEPKV